MDDRTETIAAFDHKGQQLWKVAALARGQSTETDWRSRSSDTPPGLYRVGAIYRDYEADPSTTFSVERRSYGWYSFDLEGLEAQEGPGSRDGRDGIMIHGGGWKARQIESDKPMMERLAACGFVSALVTYRLSTEAKYPAALHDCKAALRCLRAHAKELKLDPERIGCMGGSAGGHLSGLTAMTGGLADFEGVGPFQDQSSAVKACIVMAATQDMLAANSAKTNDGAVLFFGDNAHDKPEIYREASPITHVRAGVPPTIFIEGEKDTLKIGRAEMMEKLKALGIETSVHTLKNAPHPFWMSEPWCGETVKIAAAFFKKHLGEPVK
jgi:pectinesterase